MGDVGLGWDCLVVVSIKCCRGRDACYGEVLYVSWLRLVCVGLAHIFPLSIKSADARVDVSV